MGKEDEGMEKLWGKQARCPHLGGRAKLAGFCGAFRQAAELRPEGSLLCNLPHHQRRVLRSEPHAVANRMLDLSLPANIGNVIQSTFGIRSIEINCGWNFAVLHGD